MSLTRTSIFSKLPTCPSAQFLVLYKKEVLADHQRQWILEHVLGCDFCGAELQLLSEHAPAEEEYVLTDIPFGLRRLAESMLAGGKPGSDSLSDFDLDRDGLSLTDA